jgi:hypothetical protein
VTTSHLLLAIHRRKATTSLPFSQPISQFGEPHSHREPSAGGARRAHPAKVLRSKAHTEILFLLVPCPILAALKKRASNRGPIPSCQHQGFHVNSLPIIDDLSGFAPKAILIGEGQPADRVWTREEYLLLCHHMQNDNPPNEFLHVYCDSQGAPRFAKAKSPDVEKRIM